MKDGIGMLYTTAKNELYHEFRTVAGSKDFQFMNRVLKEAIEEAFKLGKLAGRDK